ncbi:TNF receptor-associated factor family protein DDB_G0290965-like isoform X1 [Hydra vulgaris]|uniref:TNF receptor-associated factor family protein DDB_G0290965-like isoform X1 n=1 Tax=Hydra vulgaris TaxID=6087 RepID=A0ABM4DK12_HYDVU
MNILRKEMSFHITDSCPNTIVPCQYFNIGCNFKGVRKEQDTHVNSSTQNHLSMAVSKVFALENKIMLNEEEITCIKNKMEMRKGQDSLTKNQLLTAISKLEKKIELIQKERETKITTPENETMLKLESASGTLTERKAKPTYKKPKCESCGNEEDLFVLKLRLYCSKCFDRNNPFCSKYDKNNHAYIELQFIDIPNNI